MPKASKSKKNAAILAEPLSREVIVSRQLTRINEIVLQMRELRRELHTLSANESLRKLFSRVSCLRCAYEWFPTNPMARSRTCPRCGSTAWDKPPTRNSRKPTDPPRPWWAGRRQSRKSSARPILRFRNRYVAPSPLEIAALDIPSNNPLTIPPPPDITQEQMDMAPIASTAYLTPPPDPVWEGSLSAYLKGNARADDPPQPETVSSHPGYRITHVDDDTPMEAPETLTVTPMKLSPVVEEFLDSAKATLGEIINEAETKAEVAETDRLSAVVDAAIEEIGVPRTDAEREELQRAQEEAWPTTRPE